MCTTGANGTGAGQKFIQYLRDKSIVDIRPMACGRCLADIGRMCALSSKLAASCALVNSRYGAVCCAGEVVSGPVALMARADP